MALLDQLTAIVGEGHVLTGADMARHATDMTGRYPSTPLAVVRPASTAEVSGLMRLADAHDLSVVPIGGNTGVTGATQTNGALMISLERMNAVREINTDARLAIVEAGVIQQQLQDAVAAQGLRYPMVFGARGSCQIGGNLSTNAGGSNVLRYGNTRALCLGLEVVLPDGRVMDMMTQLHKDNSGYDLRDLFIGAEGTLGIITAAVLKLVPAPRAHATAMLAAASLPDALRLLNQLQEATGGNVEAYEYMPRSYLEELVRAKPDLVPPLGLEHEITLLVEVATTAPHEAAAGPDGTPVITEIVQTALADALEAGLLHDAAVAQNEAQRRMMWDIREAAAEVTLTRSPIVSTDVAVPLDKFETFLREADSRARAIDAGARNLSVAHLGDGNLHYMVLPSRDDAALLAALNAMIDGLTVELGGSFSAEHGIGLSKLPSMKALKDPVALSVMRSIKATLDPKGLMNPAKVLP